MKKKIVVLTVFVVAITVVSSFYVGSADMIENSGSTNQFNVVTQSTICNDEQKKLKPRNLNFFEKAISSWNIDDAIVFDLQVKSGDLFESIRFCFPSGYQIVFSKKNSEHQKYFTFSVHYLSGYSYSRTKNSSDDEIFIIVSSDDYDKNKSKIMYEELPEATKAYLNSQGNNKFNEKLNILLSNNKDKMVGFFYDEKFPVMLVDPGSWSQKYHVDRLITESIIVRYSYDKKINASFKEIDQFVVNFINKHIVTNSKL